MRARIAAFLALAFAAGCSSSTPPNKSEPVDVTVTVTLSKGQPGRNLQLMLLPTDSMQMQGGGKTDAAGKLKTKLTPGKYTFAFDGDPAGLPKKYHSNNAAHEVVVQANATELAIKLTD